MRSSAAKFPVSASCCRARLIRQQMQTWRRFGRVFGTLVMSTAGTSFWNTSWAENREDQYPQLVAELIRLKVDIIFTSSTPAVLVAKQATKTIPIVFPISSDPVSVGIVDSFARPGGNATGLSSMASDLWPKRMELLKEAFPKVSRLAMIWNSSNPGMKLRAKETVASAGPLGVTVQDRGVRDLDGLEGLFAILSKD